MKHLLFGIKYLANYWILGKNDPLICGLVLHNKCNLRCRHCTIIDRPDASMSFDEAVHVIDVYYAKGGRCLYLEGGEPFLWQENTYTMEDIVRYAKAKGYYDIHESPMDSQKRTLEKVIINWQAENFQTDDILVMGVRV